jgi:hypothetical protein
MEDLISIVDRSKLDYTRVEHGQMARKVTLLIKDRESLNNYSARPLKGGGCRIQSA